jgi:hypothetical protein
LAGVSASAFAAPPARLVDDGRPHLGRFAGPIGHTNLLDARYRGWPRPLRWWRLKEWQALQVVTPRLFLNVALFDAKLITLVQLKLYDRARGEKHLIERTLRPRAFRLTDQLRASVTAYRDRATTLAFTNRLADGFLEVELASTTPAVTGQLRVDTAAGASQVVSLPLPRGSMYSHKGMFPVTGAITLGADRFDLDGGLALLDDHKGYYPYVMEWDWVTSAARGDDGVARGFNLTRNQCVEPERYNENCAWVGAAVGALARGDLHPHRRRHRGRALAGPRSRRPGRPDLHPDRPRRRPAEPRRDREPLPRAVRDLRRTLGARRPARGRGRRLVRDGRAVLAAMLVRPRWALLVLAAIAACRTGGRPVAAVAPTPPAAIALADGDLAVVAADRQAAYWYVEGALWRRPWRGGAVVLARPPSPILALASDGERVYAAAADRLFTVATSGGALRAVAALPAWHALVADREGAWLGVDDGVLGVDASGRARTLTRLRGPVVALTTDATRVFAATASGTIVALAKATGAPTVVASAGPDPRGRGRDRATPVLDQPTDGLASVDLRTGARRREARGRLGALGVDGDRLLLVLGGALAEWRGGRGLVAPAVDGGLIADASPLVVADAGVVVTLRDRDGRAGLWWIARPSARSRPAVVLATVATAPRALAVERDRVVYASGDRAGRPDAIVAVERATGAARPLATAGAVEALAAGRGRVAFADAATASVRAIERDGAVRTLAHGGRPGRRPDDRRDRRVVGRRLAAVARRRRRRGRGVPRADPDRGRRRRLHAGRGAATRRPRLLRLPRSPR